MQNYLFLIKGQNMTYYLWIKNLKQVCQVKIIFYIFAKENGVYPKFQCS